MHKLLIVTSIMSDNITLSQIFLNAIVHQKVDSQITLFCCLIFTACSTSSAISFHCLTLIKGELAMRCSVLTRLNLFLKKERKTKKATVEHALISILDYMLLSLHPYILTSFWLFLNISIASFQLWKLELVSGGSHINVSSSNVPILWACISLLEQLSAVQVSRRWQFKPHSH